MKIGCIGAGKHALKNILPAINEINILELHGIYCRNSKKRNSIAKEYKCLKFTTIKSLLDNDKLEAIYISSPPSLHFKHSLQALMSKKHVLVEKPLCLKISQATQLIHLAKKNNLVLMEAFMYRFHKQFKSLKKIVNQNGLSSIRATKSVFGIPKLDKSNIRYKKKLGGGSLNDLGVYPLSLINYLFVDEIKRVEAITIRRNKNKVDLTGKIRASLKENRNQIEFEWFIGGQYKNMIKIVYDQFYIITKFIFSKKKNQITEIVIVKNKRLKKIKIEPCNHFIEMLQYFKKTSLSERKMNIEYKNILSQIKCLETVRNTV